MNKLQNMYYRYGILVPTDADTNVEMRSIVEREGGKIIRRNWIWDKLYIPLVVPKMLLDFYAYDVIVFKAKTATDAIRILDMATAKFKPDSVIEFGKYKEWKGA